MPPSTSGRMPDATPRRPLMPVWWLASLVFHAEVMLLPGAKRSRHVPKFENDARASVLVVAPTVFAAATRAGE